MKGRVSKIIIAKHPHPNPPLPQGGGNYLGTPMQSIEEFFD